MWKTREVVQGWGAGEAQRVHSSFCSGVNVVFKEQLEYTTNFRFSLFGYPQLKRSLGALVFELDVLLLGIRGMLWLRKSDGSPEVSTSYCKLVLNVSASLWFTSWKDRVAVKALVSDSKANTPMSNRRGGSLWGASLKSLAWILLRILLRQLQFCRRS